MDGTTADVFSAAVDDNVLPNAAEVFMETSKDCVILGCSMVVGMTVPDKPLDDDPVTAAGLGGATAADGKLQPKQRMLK